MQPSRSDSRTLLTSIILAAGLWPAAALFAADEPAQTNRWETTAGLGLTLTRGNSENLLLVANALTQKKWEKNELRFGADGGYGESTVTVNGQDTTQKNTDFVRGFGQYNRLFTERLYGYARVDALYDEIADINYRVTISPGAGYYFLKDKRDTLSAELGPGYVFEKVGGVENDYATLRVAERFEHKFSDHARLWESADYSPQVTDFGNYVINAEVGVGADLTKKMELRVYAQDTYRSDPAPGRKENDIKIVAGLNYKF